MTFDDPDQALRWAYETTNRAIIPQSSINSMRGSEHTRPGDALTPWDFVTEAAFIKGLCKRVLPGLHFAYVTVCYGRDAEGLEPLRYFLAATLGTGIYSNRCIDRMIRDYCGDRSTIREMMQAGKCGFLKIMMLRKHSYDCLEVIHNQTIGILWGEMAGRLNPPGAAKCAVRALQ